MFLRRASSQPHVLLTLLCESQLKLVNVLFRRASSQHMLQQTHHLTAMGKCLPFREALVCVWKRVGVLIIGVVRHNILRKYGSI